MCIEDVRMGRESEVNYISTTAGNGDWRLVVNPDPNRISLSFGSGSDLVWLAPAQMIGGNVGGFPLTPGRPVAEFTLYTYGRAVQQAWHALDPAAASELRIIDVSLRRQ